MTRHAPEQNPCPVRDPEDDFVSAADLTLPQLLLFVFFAALLVVGATFAALEIHEHRNPPSQEQSP